MWLTVCCPSGPAYRNPYPNLSPADNPSPDPIALQSRGPSLACAPAMQRGVILPIWCIAYLRDAGETVFDFGDDENMNWCLWSHILEGVELHGVTATNSSS